jgi:copper chaperone CopZ
MLRRGALWLGFVADRAAGGELSATSNVIALVVASWAGGGPLLVGGSKLRAELSARADQRIVTLAVGGMTCAGCARTLESSLARIPGVSAATVRFPERRAYVVCGPALADSTLIATIQGAGPRFTAAVAAR